MQTLKVKYEIENQTVLGDLQRKYNVLFRIAFKRFQQGLNQKEIRKYFKQTISGNYKISSWVEQSAILDAKAVYDANISLKQENPIFNRKRPISIQGEMHQHSNRHFCFDKLDQNELIFKLSKINHLSIKLIGVGKNRERLLKQLQKRVGHIPISIRIDRAYIYISFETEVKYKNKLIKNRILGIDQNPNYIGISISDFQEDNQKIIYTRCFDLKNIRNKSKKKYEIVHITKQISNIASNYHIEKVAFEKLTIQSKDHRKGKIFNKSVNNDWCRKLFQETLSKYLKINNISLVEVLPQYSSYIGNLTHRDLFDPIASSCEIGRRGKFSYQKGSCVFPKFNLSEISNLTNLWKKELNWKEIKSWKDLCLAIKKAKLRYRVPLNNFIHEVSSFMSCKSQLLTYN